MIPGSGIGSRIDRLQAVELHEEKRTSVQDAILAWYRRESRDLPWRHTRDPYAVLVSEIMLQQTQVDRVLPKYLEFLALYPTLQALAAAPRAEIIRNWAPLGYNLRAVRLHEIARQAAERFGGRLPDTMEGLLSLKGIGRYTAAAVMCFAYGQAQAVLDTNVRRVLGRIFAEAAPQATEDDRVAWELAEKALPRQRSIASTHDALRDTPYAGQWPESVYDWNQALMDLGATVCISRAPKCPVCPVQHRCAARPEWYGDGVVVQEGLPMVAEGKVAYVAAPAPIDRVASRGARRRQPPARPAERFEGSRRWYRGRIVDALRASPACSALGLDDLRLALEGYGVAVDEALLCDIVEALARDGLLDLVGESGDVRVSLPQ
jgi:A/G-specific adenine glycosylase